MADPPALPHADPAMPVPLVPHPNQPTPQNPAALQAHIGQQLQHWSHFRHEFAGKPEEDADAHLHCTND